MSTNDNVTEFLRIILPSFLCHVKQSSSPTSCSVRVEGEGGRVMAVVGSCGGGTNIVVLLLLVRPILFAPVL